MITSTIPQQQPQVITYAKPTMQTVTTKLSGQPQTQLITSSVYQPAPTLKTSKDILIDLAKQPVNPLLSILRQLICLMPLILAIFVIVMTSILIHKHLSVSNTLEQSRSVVSNVERNLALKTFYDIKSKLSTEQCDQGWTELVLGQFPEVHSGCLCDDGSIHNRAYCLFRPRFSLTCSYYSGSNAMNIKFSPQSSDLYKYCVLQNKALSPCNNGKCSDDTNQKCVGAQDFCIAKTESAPFNMIEVYTGTTYTDSKLVDINGKTYIIYTIPNYGDTKPLVGTILQPGFPCWELNKEAEFDSKKNYPLSSIEAVGCGQLYKQADAKYYIETAAAYDQIELYTKNNIYNDIKKLPFQETYILKNDKLKLYGERQFGHSFAKNDCSTIDTDKLKLIKTDSKDFQEWIHGLSIAALVIAILIVITGIVFFILRKSLTKKNPVKLMYIFAVLILIVAIWGFITYLYFNTGSNSLENTIKSVDTIKACFTDKPVTQAIGDIQDLSLIHI
eukprot:TRINITY_DN50_c0_g2_i2.p1 TRINITY_DN50_c0_g2~~TRINITY_DN50_c0_g2_i2.p1  ORF type:complete len:502 (-),score=69.81 TRINITY_DN50_c0_g2_i2:4-1509(-)